MGKYVNQATDGAGSGCLTQLIIRGVAADGRGCVTETERHKILGNQMLADMVCQLVGKLGMTGAVKIEPTKETDTRFSCIRSYSGSDFATGC